MVKFDTVVVIILIWLIWIMGMATWEFVLEMEERDVRIELMRSMQND